MHESQGALVSNEYDEKDLIKHEHGSTYQSTAKGVDVGQPLLVGHH